MSDSPQRLVFVGGEEGPSPLVLDVRVSLPVLQVASELDTTILEELNHGEAKSSTHYNAQLGVFRTTIVDFVGRREALSVPAFQYLVANWRTFVSSYQNNLATYISGFAFHVAKREVAEAEVELAGKFSRLYSDISAKLFGIPISLGALVVLLDSESRLTQVLTALGIVLASFLLSGLVQSQRRQFKRVKHAKEMTFRAFEGRKSSYPKELQTDLSKMKSGLNQDQDFHKWVLIVLQFLVWIPTVLAIVFLF